jgi:hypothetical protein
MFPYFLSLLLAAIAPLAPEMPNRQPQLAASKDTVAMVFASGDSVQFATSTDNGATFSKSAPIATVPGLMARRHRGPRVAFAGDAILVSAIGATDGDLLLWRSADRGKTWSKPAAINDLPKAAREGLNALAADAQGHAAAVWLDLRTPGTKLYGSVSNDFGKTWSKNFVVYQSAGNTICECCHPSLAPLGNGEFAVMFRNVVDENRDMYVMHIKDGSVIAGAQKAGKGSWALKACPMDGGGLVQDGKQTLTAWRRGEDVFIAPLGREEHQIGTGKDVALAASHGRQFAVWTAKDGIRSWSAGREELLAKSGGFPSVVALPNGGALAAWEEEGKISLHRLE